MALAIDTKHLTEKFMPKVESYFNSFVRGTGRNLQLQRVVVYNIFHSDHYIYWDTSSTEQCYKNWQPDDQGDEKDPLEVLSELKQVAAKTTPFMHPGVPVPTVSVANAQSPSFTSPAEEDPPSSSRRFSVRMVMQEVINDIQFTNLKDVIPNFPSKIIGLDCNLDHIKFGSYLKASDPYNPGIPPCMISHVQLEFVDLSTPSYVSTGPAGKRRRTLNPFHHVSWRGDRQDPVAKKFKGVKYRPDQSRWIAEMTPPGRGKKVHFGTFKTEAEAARVVDVAFHHYGKELNFPDTPKILSKRPTSDGLDEEAKLKLVKKQAEWMKTMLPSLVSRESKPFAGEAGVVASVQNSFEIPCTMDTSGLLSFSPISSSVIIRSPDLADDGISQPRPGAEALMASSDLAEGKETMEQNFDLADHAVVDPKSGDEQSMMPWSVDDAVVDPRQIGIVPEHSTVSGTLTNMPGSSSGVEQLWWMPGVSSMSPTVGVWTPLESHDNAAPDDVNWFPFCPG